MVATRTEEYIETIYEVVHKKGYAKVVDVSRLLSVGPPAVSEMFHKLSDEAYVNYEKYSGVTLTEKGMELAVELSRRHQVLKDFLVILGLDREIADEDACKIEHVVNPETMARLTKFVEFVRSLDDPLWLERFRMYYEEGELGECPRVTKRKE